MSVNIRYPSITATTEREQISQIKSYLHQLVEQLNYALPSIGSSGTQTFEVQGAEMSYYDLRSLIIQELQEVEELFEALEADILRAKENGEFDGYTPVKGKDYFTEEEIDDTATRAAEKFLFTLDEEGNLYYEIKEE